MGAFSYGAGGRPGAKRKAPSPSLPRLVLSCVSCVFGLFLFPHHLNLNESSMGEYMRGNRKLARLKNYNYSSEGYYFVTICTQDRRSLFGKVEVGNDPGAGPGMVLNDIGWMVKSMWTQLPIYYPNIGIDEYVVMPNHLHGIVAMAGAGLPRPLSVKSVFKHFSGAETAPLRIPALGQMVAYFKYQTTKGINIIRSTPGVSVWQRGYYDHIIRSENDLNRVRQYILENPAKWADDPENPESYAV